MSPPKFVVGTTVPEATYLRLLDHPGGISGFYAEAVMHFNGDLEALVKAAAEFGNIRKAARRTSPIRAANGRVLKDVHDRIQSIETSLGSIRGMSRAKVLAGLIHLYLENM